MASIARSQPGRRRPPRFPLTVARYDAMVEAGILTRADRVELIEGELVPKMSLAPPYPAGQEDRPRLERLPIVGWFVTREDPIVLSEWSKPEPGAALVRGDLDDYEYRDVTAAECCAGR